MRYRRTSHPSVPTMPIIPGRESLPVVYRGTISSLRISSVDGTAFLDNCAALVPYADGNHLVEIYDASGRMLRGYLAAAGTGETYQTPVLDDDMSEDNTGNYIKNDCALTFDTDHYVMTQTNASHGITQNVLNSLYGLFRQTIVARLGTQANIALFNFPVTAPSSTLTGDYATYTYYVTQYLASPMQQGVFTYIGSNGLTTFIQGHQIAQVLTPSTSGATIVSAKGGETANFQYKNASFTYNAASYYCLIKRAR